MFTGIFKSATISNFPWEKMNNHFFCKKKTSMCLCMMEDRSVKAP